MYVSLTVMRLRYTIGARYVCKLNSCEVIAVSTLWCLDIDDLTIADYRAMLEHVNFVTTRARDDYFRDSAHVEYVLAIRKLVENIGFEAFSNTHDSESVAHYGPQNMRPRKGGNYST